jgi:hypothetical protein
MLGAHRPTLGGYRFAVRSLLPRVAYAETMLHRKQMPADVPSAALDEFNQQVAMLAADDHWATYRRHAGVGTHLLAGLIFVLPKVGPIGDLSILGPSASGEQDYVNSLMHTTDALRQALAQATRSGGLPNKDLDTGDDVHPGTYSLEDYAYADLLHMMTRDPGSPIPFGIKRDLLVYFADPAKVTYVQNKPKLLARVEADLAVLKTISTRAEYPATAFLPEPDADKPSSSAAPAAGDAHPGAGAPSKPQL